MKCQLELIKKKIAAVIPAPHAEGGEAALVITTDGEKYLDRRSTGWIIKRLAQLYNTDLHAVKKNYGPLLGRKRLIPIPLGVKLVFLPLTFKTDTFPLDRKLGYISLEQIKGVRKEADGNILVLKNSLELRCFNTMSTIHLKIREGGLLQKILKSELLQGEASCYLAEKNSCLAGTICREETAPLAAAFFYCPKKPPPGKSFKT